MSQQRKDWSIRIQLSGTPDGQSCREENRNMFLKVLSRGISIRIPMIGLFLFQVPCLGGPRLWPGAWEVWAIPEGLLVVVGEKGVFLVEENRMRITRIKKTLPSTEIALVEKIGPMNKKDPKPGCHLPSVNS